MSKANWHFRAGIKYPLGRLVQLHGLAKCYDVEASVSKSHNFLLIIEPKDQGTLSNH